MEEQGEVSDKKEKREIKVVQREELRLYNAAVG